MSTDSSLQISSPVPSAWQLPAGIRLRLGREAGAQRAMLEEGHLLVILHEPPAADGVDRTPAFFWRTPAGEWKAKRASGGGLGDYLRGYEERLLKIEALESKAATAQEYHSILESTAPLLRTARGLHRALQQAREMVAADRELITHRDRAAALERTAELLLQDAQFGLSFIAARQAEAQAETAARMTATGHRLNVLAAIFLPLTAVASALAMEVKSGLRDTRENFWLIVGGSLLLGMLMALAIRRKS